LRELKIYSEDVDGILKEKNYKLNEIIQLVKVDEGNDLIKIRNLLQFKEEEEATFKMLGILVT